MNLKLVIFLLVALVGCGTSASKDLDLLGQIKFDVTTSLEQRCDSYEQSLKQEYIRQQRPLVNREKLFEGVLSSTPDSIPSSLKADEQRILTDLRKCFNELQEAKVESSSILDRAALVALSKAQQESKKLTLVDRCQVFDDVLVEHLSNQKNQLASASKPARFETIIGELESRQLPFGNSQPVLQGLIECVEHLDLYRSSSDVPTRTVIAGPTPHLPTGLPHNHHMEEALDEFKSVRTRVKDFGQDLYAGKRQVHGSKSVNDHLSHGDFKGEMHHGAMPTENGHHKSVRHESLHIESGQRESGHDDNGHHANIRHESGHIESGHHEAGPSHSGYAGNGYYENELHNNGYYDNGHQKDGSIEIGYPDNEYQEDKIDDSSLFVGPMAHNQMAPGSCEYEAGRVHQLDAELEYKDRINIELAKELRGVKHQLALAKQAFEAQLKRAHYTDQDDEEDDADDDDVEFKLSDVIKSVKKKSKKVKKDRKNKKEEDEKVYEDLADIARKLQDKMNSSESPKNKCFKYYLVFNYPGKVTRKMIKMLAKLVLPETLNPSVDYYETLDRYVQLLRNSGNKQTDLALGELEECFVKDPATASFSGPTEPELGPQAHFESYRQEIPVYDARTTSPHHFTAPRMEDVELVSAHHAPKTYGNRGMPRVKKSWGYSHASASAGDGQHVYTVHSSSY